MRPFKIFWRDMGHGLILLLSLPVLASSFEYMLVCAFFIYALLRIWYSEIIRISCAIALSSAMPLGSCARLGVVAGKHARSFFDLHLSA